MFLTKSEEEEDDKRWMVPSLSSYVPADLLTFVVDEVVTIYLAVFSNQPLHCTNTGGYNITSSTTFSIGLVKFQCANTEILWCE